LHPVGTSYKVISPLFAAGWTWIAHDGRKRKTIIIDNVGLYNYFGLPDANRKWQHHFKGREDVEYASCKGQERDNLRDHDYEFDENRFHEDDEEMQIVRGASFNKNYCCPLKLK